MAVPIEEEPEGSRLLAEIGAYRVGQRGWIEVLDSDGSRRWIEGEIVSLIQTPKEHVYALIKTCKGTGLYRVW